MKKKKALQKLFAFMAHLSEHRCGYKIELDGYDDPILISTLSDGVRLINLKFMLDRRARDYEFVASMGCYELDPDDLEDTVLVGPDLFALLADLRQEYLSDFHPHMLKTDEEDEGDPK